jgi:carbon storage regulator
MLVLTRRAGESIVIGDDVRVIVLDVRGDTVRLGIEAPRSIQVHRAEVYAEVQAANAAAAAPSSDHEDVADRLRRIARPAVPRPAAPNRRTVDRRQADPRTGSGRPNSGEPAKAPEPKPGPPRPSVPRPGPPKPGPPRPPQPAPVLPGQPTPPSE